MLPDAAEPAGTKPWLSVLIPAYEHPAGVERILQALQLNTLGGIECIISDDSASRNIAEVVRPYTEGQAQVIRYHRNTPALGAPENWNLLLARATGEYVLLLHHDEFPEDGDFFKKLRQEIIKQDHPDVIVLKCLVPTLGMKRLRQHQPTWLQKVTLKHAHNMLALHNVIGPPSALVLKAPLAISFDPRLKWLVDVEWMMRIFAMKGIRWVIAPSIFVVSWPNPDVSITRQIKPRLRAIRDKESAILAKDIDDWLMSTLLYPQSMFESLLSRMERIIWAGLRLCVIACLHLRSRPFPPDVSVHRKA